jgi:hypothetical protein
LCVDTGSASNRKLRQWIGGEVNILTLSVHVFVCVQVIEFFANGTAIEEYKPRTPQQLGLHPRDVVLFAPLSRLAAPQVGWFVECKIAEAGSWQLASCSHVACVASARCCV